MFSILNMDFSERVKSRMQALQLSSVELAQLVGVSKGSITHWTNGTNQASGKRLIALANALECNAIWLATGEGSEAGPSSTAPAESSNESKLPVASKAAAASMILGMLKKHAGKSLNSAAQQRIAQAVAESLSENEPTKPNNVIPADFSRNQVRKGELLIPEYDIRGAMGAGQLPGEYVETVRNLIVNEAHLRAHGVNYSAPEHLAMITGWGESMTPTINDKDPVMVDRGVTNFIGEGIYVVTWHKLLYIKRVQVLDEKNYLLISDNDRYPNQTARMEDVIFHAKVLLIWNARKG
ncbi:Peptidase S24-like protein [compost metagenome]